MTTADQETKNCHVTRNAVVDGGPPVPVDQNGVDLGELQWMCNINGLDTANGNQADLIVLLKAYGNHEVAGQK